MCIYDTLKNTQYICMSMGLEWRETGQSDVAHFRTQIVKGWNKQGNRRGYDTEDPQDSVTGSQYLGITALSNL